MLTAQKIIEQYSPEIFGGPIFGYFNQAKPKWYRYGSHDPLKNAKFLSLNEYGLIFEGNSFYKRYLLSKYGGFDPLYGPKAEKIGFGEGANFIERIIRDRQVKIYFDPKLYVYHLVLSKKMKWSFNIKASFIAGRSIHKQKKNESVLQAKKSYLFKQFAKTFLALVKDLFRGLTIRDRERYPYVQNYFFESSLKYVKQLGRIYGLHLKRTNDITKS